VPRYDPPTDFAGQPHGYLLPPRTRLWRLHEARYPACVFNPSLAGHCRPGNRFDATKTDPYGFTYAAREQSTAIAERFLRGQQFDGPAGRLIPYRALQGCRISAVEVAYELRLTTLLSAVDLAAVSQDDWLVQAEPAEFPDTRRWGHWLRAIDPTTQGLIWQSRRDRPHDVVVLFEDRCGPGSPLQPLGLPHIDLDTPDGVKVLQGHAAALPRLGLAAQNGSVTARMLNTAPCGSVATANRPGSTAWTGFPAPQAPPHGRHMVGRAGWGGGSDLLAPTRVAARGRRRGGVGGVDRLRRDLDGHRCADPDARSGGSVAVCRDGHLGGARPPGAWLGGAAGLAGTGGEQPAW
jgi:hypothetical protein